MTHRDLDDSAVHARAGGKARVQASILWTVTVGPVSFRCRPDGDGFRLECKIASGSWDLVSSQNIKSSEVLFDLVATSVLIRNALRAGKKPQGGA